MNHLLRFLLIACLCLSMGAQAQTVSNGWTKRFDFPALTYSGYAARPQGIIALSNDELVVTAHFGDQYSRAYKVSTSGTVLGQFGFPAPYKHVAAIARSADGRYWVSEYLTGTLLEVDLDASFTSGTAVIRGVRTVGWASTCCAIDWATVSDKEYLLLSEYRTTGAPITTVVHHESGRRLTITQRAQGIVYKDGLLYIVSNRLTGEASGLGRVQVIDFDTFIELGAQDGIWTDYLVDDFLAPSNYPEDLAFTPDGTLWTMTEGNTSVGTAGWLAVWSKTLP